jgi:hypothetical protein
MSSEKSLLGTNGDVFASAPELLKMVEPASAVEGLLVVTSARSFVDKGTSSPIRSTRPSLGTSGNVFSSAPELLMVVEPASSVEGLLRLRILGLRIEVAGPLLAERFGYWKGEILLWLDWMFSFHTSNE